MYKLRKRDWTITKDYSEILNEQAEFYKELYTANPDVKFSLTNNSGILLSEDQKLELDSEIQEDEFITALKSMKGNRTPGCDGLTREFYLKFYDKLKTLR